MVQTAFVKLYFRMVRKVSYMNFSNILTFPSDLVIASHFKGKGCKWSLTSKWFPNFGIIKTVFIISHRILFFIWATIMAVLSYKNEGQLHVMKKKCKYYELRKLKWQNVDYLLMKYYVCTTSVLQDIKSNITPDHSQFICCYSEVIF